MDPRNELPVSRHGRVTVGRAKIALVSLAVALLVAGGCASVRPYDASHPDNLTFSSPGLQGSLFSSPDVSLHVFFADDACELSYQGSVVLAPGSGPRQIGLPTGRDIYARIRVYDRSWLRNRTKTRIDEFHFAPSPGYHYELRYSHQRKLYGRTIEETNVRTSRTREMRVGGWGDCAS